MTLTDIVNRVNRKLAGETLTYNQLKDHLDDVIDDINDQLNSSFPVFSELATGATEYTAIPDRYIRKVIVSGAAWYFYTMDEEGEQVAAQFSADYQRSMFYMVRDYSSQIPEEYQAADTGHLTFTSEETMGERGIEIDGNYFQL